MLTAIMISMFYLGTAAGVMGAALMGTFAPSERRNQESLDENVTDLDELGRAA
jgi:hypothetical protein